MGGWKGGGKERRIPLLELGRTSFGGNRNGNGGRMFVESERFMTEGVHLAHIFQVLEI